MSRARKQNRDNANFVNKNLEVPVAEDKKELHYDFDIRTPQGTFKVKVPHSGLKQCPCGSTIFEELFRIAFVQPKGILGAAPMAFKVAVNSCKKCGREIGPDDQSIAEASGQVEEVDSQEFKSDVIKSANGIIVP